MIESQHGRRGRVMQSNGTRIVQRLRHTAGRGDVHGARGMATRIAHRIGITTEQRRQRHIQTGFLLGFAPRRLLQRLTDIDEAARQGPAGGGYRRSISTMGRSGRSIISMMMSTVSSGVTGRVMCDRLTARVSAPRYRADTPAGPVRR